MNALEERLLARIRAGGPVTFEAFMETALYEPGLGYYARDSSAIGRAGDFYTSPHLHRVFGALLGRQVEEFWELLGRPKPFDVAEVGAGMGYLAKDLLDHLAGREAGGALRYAIVERNPAVRERQAALLREHRREIRWVAREEELEALTGCFLSNELLDAFPVRVVVASGGDLQEVHVGVEGGALVEVLRPCSPEVREALRREGVELPPRYRTEVNLGIREWIATVSSRLSRGFVLTIDYGYTAREYYSPERDRGTLLCYHRHRVVADPYRNIGEQDLTAHVDFSSLRTWGEEAGLTTLGYCPQGTYLAALGIDEVLRELPGGPPDAAERAQIAALILPQGMGESHQVMIQGKGVAPVALRGFSLRNRLGSL